MGKRGDNKLKSKNVQKIDINHFFAAIQVFSEAIAKHYHILRCKNKEI